MPRSAFEDLNRNLNPAHDRIYSNPRNAAAGTLRSHRPKDVAERNLSLWVYANHSPWKDPSHYRSLLQLTALGLPVNPHNTLLENIGQVPNLFQEFLERREEFDYDIDGVVVKVDNDTEQDFLGATGHEPRWAIAWKFPSQRTTTKLEAIEISMGRFGTLTPVACLSPRQHRRGHRHPRFSTQPGRHPPQGHQSQRPSNHRTRRRRHSPGHRPRRYGPQPHQPAVRHAHPLPELPNPNRQGQGRGQPLVSKHRLPATTPGPATALRQPRRHEHRRPRPKLVPSPDRQ